VRVPRRSRQRVDLERLGLVNLTARGEIERVGVLLQPARHIVEQALRLAFLKRHASLEELRRFLPAGRRLAVEPM
jgi:hypothetical protein